MIDVLIRIKRAVIEGQFDFSAKAIDEMEADGLTPLDVAESVVNAVAIYKRLRSTSRLRKGRTEYLYVIQSTNLEGLLVYSKGRLVSAAGRDRYYFLVSAKRAL